MIGLGRYGAGADFRAWLERDVVGERSPPPDLPPVSGGG
jgi:hypothetical protein